MNLNRIVNMVVALVLRRFINMGISKATALLFRRNRTTRLPTQAAPDAVSEGTPVAPRRVLVQSAPGVPPVLQPPAAPVPTELPPTPEARAARRARQLARRAARRANGG